MSRIGNLPIKIPEGVNITIGKDNEVVVKGQLGELTRKVVSDLTVEIRDDSLIVSRSSDQKHHKSLHGLYRSLINNMVIGVSEGYEIKQELVGVGYKAAANGQRLELSVGYSHDIIFEMPPEVTVETVTERRSNPIITLKSIDKQLVGMIASKIRSFRKPEPYKGKGIKYVGEHIRKKAGKAAVSTM